MIQTEFSAAVNQVCAERGIEPAVVYETIKTALLAAYRKDFGGKVEELEVKLDEDSGEAKIFKDKEDITPPGFGRIAAQTAKQVILQKIREAEKDAIITEYQGKIGAIESGHIFRVEKGTAVIDLGRAQAIMPPLEQIPGETYTLNQRLKVLVSRIEEGEKGAKIIASRADPQFVKELFALEVPEIRSGTVKIENIAREAGGRTKIAVSSSEKNVDPVGSCVGRKGVRVQAVLKELGEERIDVTVFSKEDEEYVTNALSPAKVEKTVLNKKKKEAKVTVSPDQLSLAIGKGGQNVRLAAKLTGWKIDIKGAEKGLEELGLSGRIVNALGKAGVITVEELKAKSEKELLEIKGIGKKAVAEIKKKLK